MKGKVYKTVVRPVMMYCLVALRNIQEAELKVAKLKEMLIFSLSDKDGQNEYVRWTTYVRCFWRLSEARLRWFGYVQRRDGEIGTTRQEV